MLLWWYLILTKTYQWCHSPCVSQLPTKCLVDGYYGATIVLHQNHKKKNGTLRIRIISVRVQRRHMLGNDTRSQSKPCRTLQVGYGVCYYQLIQFSVRLDLIGDLGLDG
jgi:hypothetical protein